MAPIGGALLGSGIFVKEQHYPAFFQDPSLFILKAVYSRSKSSVDALLSSPPALTTTSTIDDVKNPTFSPLSPASTTATILSNVDKYSDDSPSGSQLDDLLSREDISFVVIALPILAQPSYIKKALLAGKHVFAEKPVAKDLASANELLQWRKSSLSSSTAPIFSIAENYRFQEQLRYARSLLLPSTSSSSEPGFGKLISFRVESMGFVEAGTKYFETTWRKVPEYQGGFCLDAGVHFAAALRFLVNRDISNGENNIESVSAFTTLNQSHLPPIDTITATIKLKSGVAGTYVNSFGSPGYSNFEFVFACQGGFVKVVSGGKVVSKKIGGEEEVKVFDKDVNGARSEVRAFVESVIKGKADELQSPELAVGDLEISTSWKELMKTIIRQIEKMIQSGEQNGKVLAITGGLESS